MTHFSPESLRSEGLLASDLAVARVAQRSGLPGTPDSGPVLDVSIAAGPRLEVLPDRGFDIGRTEVSGIPLSWTSPVSDSRPLDRPRDRDWLERFTGGLLVTCGLGNIGPANNAQGLHGDISHRPAQHVRSAPSRGRAALLLEADVDSASIYGPSLRLERAIAVARHDDGSCEIAIEDNVVNVGVQDAPISMLYHVNVGAPLVLPGTRVEVDAISTVHREDSIGDWRVVPPPSTDLVETVVSHTGVPADSAGMSRCQISSPLGLQLEVAWSSTTLPYLHQWVLPTRGLWALGIEPATGPLFGADRRGAGAGTPTLAAGATQRHRIVVTTSPSWARELTSIR